MRRLPTVNDLRVKECYICREEEVYDKPARPPKRWVHPCKCSLIAHEDCLLEWIRASENNPDKPLSSILKCPQCGERYKLESKNPLVLRVMDFGNRMMQKCGTVVSILSVAAGVTSVGTGVYILSTGYGAYAVRQFLGPEMYDLVLGDEIDQWPTSSFITLPLIPLSLILSKTKRYRDSLPLVTLMTLWPTVPRINGVPEGQGFLAFLGLGSRTPWKLPRIREPASVNRISTDLFKDIFFSWPPSPFMFHVGLGVVRSYYGRFLQRLRQSILGDTPEGDEGDGGQELALDNFQMELRIEGGDEEEEEEEEGNANHPQREGRHRDAAQNAANDQADHLRDENNVRLVLDAAEEGPVAVDGHPAGPAPGPAQHQPEGQPQAAGANLDRAENGLLEGRVRQVDQPNPERNQGEDRGGNAAARVRLQMTTTYLGSLVGSALIVPPLSSFTGSVLLRLALPQVRNAHKTLDFRGYPPYHPRRLLCSFLGVQPPGSAPYYPMMGLYAFREDMPAGELMRAMILLSCRAMLVGTPAWTESDPVWWRNTIGLGIFYFAKDMLSIWYHYLSQREIRSRRVRDRAFDGINPTELDLKPEVRDVFQDG